MNIAEITRRDFETQRHKTSYLSCGPEDGPLIIFTHGWPELSLSWRHQLRCFAALGFHAVAPDMRGYGQSSVYKTHDAYAQVHAVQDMLELLDHLAQEKAIWVGHDWGAPVAWNIASHHPEVCHGVAGLCVPYASLEQGLDFVISLVDRSIYPEDEYPVGQWDYMRFYEAEFEAATRPMDANPRAMVQALFRAGSSVGLDQPAATSMVSKQGGWFGGLDEAPDVPIDERVISEAELNVYAEGLQRNGFFGPNSWYMNHEANAAYFKTAVNGAKLDLPALFLAARYDTVCESVNSRLTEPMREKCSNLTESIIDSGHWIAQEKPREVNRALVKWIATKLPGLL